jgi:hypothetical protein
MKVPRHSRERLIERFGFEPTRKDLIAMRRKVLKGQYRNLESEEGYTRKPHTILGELTYKGVRVAFSFHIFANNFVTFMKPPRTENRGLHIQLGDFWKN